MIEIVTSDPPHHPIALWTEKKKQILVVDDKINTHSYIAGQTNNNREMNNKNKKQCSPEIHSKKKFNSEFYFYPKDSFIK